MTTEIEELALIAKLAKLLPKNTQEAERIIDASIRSGIGYTALTRVLNYFDLDCFQISGCSDWHIFPKAPRVKLELSQLPYKIVNCGFTK
jgi:hypothetical protein